MASDWERTHVELPIYRHRNRGNLWLVQGKPLFLPGASLTDVVGLLKSIDEVNNPPAVKPVKPAPVVQQHSYPRFVAPHSSWVEYPNGDKPFVEGYKFSVGRDDNVVSVYVTNAADERRLLSPKQWKK